VSASFVPQISSKFLLSDFSPLVRYMYGFDSKNNSFAINPSQPTLLRTLQLFSTVGLQLSRSTQIRFWDENGILYNSAGGGWFVPLDAMVTLYLHWVLANQWCKPFSLMFGQSMERFPYGFDEFVSISSITKTTRRWFLFMGRNILSCSFIART
jgi:hypothetical protein